MQPDLFGIVQRAANLGFGSDFPAGDTEDIELAEFAVVLERLITSGQRGIITIIGRGIWCVAGIRDRPDALGTSSKHRAKGEEQTGVDTFHIFLELFLIV